MVLGSLPHLLHGEVGLLVGCLTWVSKPVVEALRGPPGHNAGSDSGMSVPVRMNGWPFQDGGAACSQLATKWLVDFLVQ